MKIDENYTVEHDGSCWTLYYRAEGSLNQKTGKPVVSEHQTYHATLKQALGAYFDRMLAIGQPTPEHIDQLYAKIKEVYKFLEP